MRFSSELLWIMPIPKPKLENAKNIIAVFGNTVWIYLGSTVILATIVFACLDHCDRRMTVDWYKSFSKAMSGFINEPIPASYYKLNTKSKTILFFLWVPIAYCLCLSYKANLLVNLLAVTYEEKIDTSEQVLNSGLALWIPSSGIHYNVFFKAESQVLIDIRESNILQNGGLYPPPGTAVPKA